MLAVLAVLCTLRAVYGMCRGGEYHGTKFMSYTNKSPRLHPLQVEPPAQLACRGLISVENRTGRARAQPPRVIIFKTARTGSTWIHQTLNAGLTQHWPDATDGSVFEPFCNPRCTELLENGVVSKDEVTAGFRSLLGLTSGVSRTHALRPSKCERLFKRINRPLHNAATVLSFNPRFTPTAVFSNFGLEDGAIAAINLRRTNLVRMAYSKHHHGTTNTRNCHGNGRSFGLAELLCGVWHYGIGDQEFASLAALKATLAVGRSPRLILYEDVQHHKVAMEELLFADVLGVPKRQANALAIQETASEEQKKRHTASDMCSYDDVQCKGVKAIPTWLPADTFPCLAKQWVADESVAWTVPMLPNGSISLHGNCSRLSPLEPQQWRRFSELY